MRPIRRLGLFALLLAVAGCEVRSQLLPSWPDAGASADNDRAVVSVRPTDSADPALLSGDQRYCAQIDADISQCVVFGAATVEAAPVSVEYIISNAFYEALPEDERAHWRPRTYERTPAYAGQAKPGLGRQAPDAQDFAPLPGRGASDRRALQHKVSRRPGSSVSANRVP